MLDGYRVVQVSSPDGAAAPKYRPVINAFTPQGGGVFTLTGRQLNGQSAGAHYGDNVQMDENYPIVRLEDPTGKVFYCTTTNWSLLGVATGLPNLETVTFKVPAGLAPGGYTVTVSGAGIQSVPVGLNIAAGQL